MLCSQISWEQGQAPSPSCGHLFGVVVQNWYRSWQELPMGQMILAWAGMYQTWDIFFIYFRLQTSSVLIGYLSEQMCLRPLQMCQYQIFQRNESFTLCYAILPSVMSLVCNSKFRLRIAAFVGRQCGTVCQQHCETVTCNWKRAYLQHDKHRTALLLHFCDSSALI